jgi:hypothetical protein
MVFTDKKGRLKKAIGTMERVVKRGRKVLGRSGTNA